jgi:hypothetical protein
MYSQDSVQNPCTPAGLLRAVILLCPTASCFLTVSLRLHQSNARPEPFELLWSPIEFALSRAQGLRRYKDCLSAQFQDLPSRNRALSPANRCALATPQGQCAISYAMHRKDQSVQENGEIHEEAPMPDIVEVILNVFVN